MTVRITKNFDEAYWWDVVENCAYATFFHTPLWSRLIRMTYENCQDTSLGFVLADGVPGLLPLMQTWQRGYLFKNYVSTFAGCYGGGVAKRPLTPAEERAIYAEVCRWNTVSLKINDNPLAGQSPKDLDQFTGEKDFTHILFLNADFDTIFANFSGSHRTNARKGKRLGVTTRVANTTEDYKDYFMLYQDSLRRWGDNATSYYPWALFESCYNLAQQRPNNIQLWVAEVEEHIIAGALIFYWKSHAVYWHGAACEHYFDYKPNNVLHTAIIKQAITDGRQYYDFNPSGGHAGVVQFKQRFGAEKKQLTNWKYSSPLINIRRKMKQPFT